MNFSSVHSCAVTCHAVVQKQAFLGLYLLGGLGRFLTTTRSSAPQPIPPAISAADRAVPLCPTHSKCQLKGSLPGYETPSPAVCLSLISKTSWKMGRAHSSLWPNSRGEFQEAHPSHINSADRQVLKKLKTQTMSITKNTTLFHTVELVFLSASKNWRNQEQEAVWRRPDASAAYCLQKYINSKERRGWKEGHPKITAGLSAQPQRLSHLLTCWLSPTKQMLAKLLSIPGSSIIIWWHFKQTNNGESVHNLYLFSQAVSGIGVRPPGKEKRKRLPFIWVKKIEGSLVNLE